MTMKLECGCVLKKDKKTQFESIVQCRKHKYPNWPKIKELAAIIRERIIK